MITALQISGLGPIESLIAAMPGRSGVVRISGESETGKSTIIDSVALALWGTLADGSIIDPASTTGDPQATVTMLSGWRCGWRRRPSGAIALMGDDATMLTVARSVITGRLGKAGTRLAQLIYSPAMWRTLAMSTGGRDLIAVLAGLPGPTAADVLAERGIEPVTLAAAEKARAAATGARDRAAGAVAQAAASLTAAEAVEVVAVDPELLAAACAEIAEIAAARSAASERGAEIARVTAARAACSRALLDRDAWDRRAAGLTKPEQPGPTTAEIDAAREAITAWEKQERAPRPEQPIRDRGWVFEPSATACPGASACQIGDRAREEADRRNDDHASRWSVYDAWLAVQIIEPVDARAVMGRAQAWAQYNSRRSDLGPWPEVPADPGPAPEPITIPQQQHAAVIRAAEAHPALLAQRDAAISRARAALSDAEAAAAASRLAADAAIAAAAAIKTAPAEALRRKLASIAVGGGVQLAVSDDADLSITIDGRPWFIASTGRQIAASAHLRHALRLALGASWLPIAVDEAQSCTGSARTLLDEVPGPMIIASTTAGPLLVELAA